LEVFEADSKRKENDMRSNFFSGRAFAAAVIALSGAMLASACTAQDTTPRTVTVAAGQGGSITVPVPAPAQQVYALTGEQSAYRQTAAAWHRQAGPVYSAGNARIVMPDAR
jgi:hypothetical protein